MLSLLRTMEPTPLSRFIAANGIKLVQLAEVSGVSRQHIYRLRTGRMEPTRPVMIWLTEAACYILKRRVAVPELFDLTINVNDELLGCREIAGGGVMPSSQPLVTGGGSN